MPGRKRTIDEATSNNNNTAKKKIKTSKTPRKDHHSSSSSQSAPFYAIRDIINEKGGKYLIDWEDDPVTGEKFKPTWEPKSCANDLAVAAWEQKKREASQKKPGTARPIKSKTVQSPQVLPTKTRPARRARIITSSSSPPPAAQPGPGPADQVEAEIADSQLPQSTPNSRPRLAVEISPHSSLLQNSDIPFISSLPINYHSDEEEIESSTRQPSPFSQVSPVVERIYSLIVPDSQANQNSSSPLVDVDQAQHDPEAEPSIADSQQEGSWQGGQGIHDPGPPASEISSRSPPSQVPSENGDTETGLNHNEANHPQTHLITEPVLSSQIEEHSTQASRSTDCSVLTQRDPNSQPDKSGHSVELKENGLIASIEPPDTEPEHLPGSTSPLRSHHNAQSFTTSILPRTPSPRITMSDAAYTNSGLRNPQYRQNELSPPGYTPLKDKLRNLRATPSPASQFSKSPSMIPQPAQPEPVGDTRLKVQSVDVPLPTYNHQPELYTPSKPSKLAFHHSVPQKRTVKALEVPLLSNMEYIVPLPAPGRVKDQYVNMIKFYKQTIQNFMDEASLDEQLTKEVDRFLESVDNAATHIDLDNPTTVSQQPVPPDQEAQYATNCSAKFQFLQELITCMRDQDVHILIVAQSGRLLDILEAFMKWMQVEYIRPDSLARSGPMRTQSRLRFTILPSKEQASPMLLPTANAIIALDGSFTNGGYHLQQSRTPPLNAGQLAPIIYPIVYASSEHIVRCIPDSIVGVERKRVIVSCVTQARTLFGELPIEEADPKGAAEEVGEFIKAGCVEGTWTLPSIRPIPIEGIEWVDASQSSTTQSDTQDTREESATPMMRKRSLDAMNDTGSLKRQRVTPGPETSHVSDSAAQTSQPSMPDVQKALQDANAQLATLKLSHQKREASMRETINGLQSRLQEISNDLSLLQDRNEELTAERANLKHEKDDLITAAATIEKKLASRATEIADLKEERKGLKAELEEARNALKGSVVPEIAELEKAKEEARAAVQERDSLQKKIASLKQDFEFTRQQYQQASTAAAESSNRNTELEAENVELRKKASGEATRAKEITVKNAHVIHEKRIQQLEAMLEERDELLRKRDRGRGVQTRSGSVQPRSPRPGNSRAGSRAGSPMAPVPFGGLGAKVGSGLRFG